MKMEYRVRILAGTVVLAGVLLTWLVSPWWLLLLTFVGVNLIQSPFTGICPGEMILSRIYREKPAPGRP